MPTPTNRAPASMVGKTEHLDLAYAMDPGIFSVIDADVDDNDTFTVGVAAKLAKSVWIVIVDEAEVAIAMVDDDGDAVTVKELGLFTTDGNAVTSKFTATVDTTDAKYMFGISSSNLVFKNTDGANKHIQLFRLT